jgi:hypothetical protein
MLEGSGRKVEVCRSNFCRAWRLWPEAVNYATWGLFGSPCSRLYCRSITLEVIVYEYDLKISGLITLQFW